MRCRTLRSDCSSGELALRDPRAVEHVRECADCRAFLARLETAREVLATPLCDARPDAGFAARVAARLPRPVEILGMAALRLLPAAVALLLALAAYGQGQPPSAADLWLLEPSSGQLLAWSVLADGEPAP
jgi:hypothetical protein